MLTGGSFTYALASGTGSNDNAAFTINGNQLQAATVFDSLAKSSYNILLLVTDQNGLTYLQPMTITVKAGPYTQWKVANFGASAGNAAVAGDLVDSQNDGLPNLVKYALGLPPAALATSGITAQNNGTNLVMNYTRLDRRHGCDRDRAGDQRSDRSGKLDQHRDHANDALRQRHDSAMAGNDSGQFEQADVHAPDGDAAVRARALTFSVCPFEESLERVTQSSGVSE